MKRKEQVERPQERGLFGVFEQKQGAILLK